MKKLNDKGFGHHLLILAIAVVVVAVAGFSGYMVYKSRNIDAQASSPQIIALGIGGDLQVCKEYNKSGGYKLKGRIVASPTGPGFTGNWYWATTGGTGDFPANQNLPNVKSGAKSAYFYSSSSVPNSKIAKVQNVAITRGC